ncbi:MAG: acetate--CoA ligase family protein [Pseudomonadota bacterium]
MRNFLEPESVAMIGAPRKTGPDTYNVVEMMLRYGYQGRLYPINPKADEICGLKAYHSIAEVPETVDLAIISLGRDHVIPAFKECIQSGLRRVIIISQGFADADPHGGKLQAEIVRLARESGVRVIGPNTLGVLNNFRNLSTSFIDLARPKKVPPVSLIAQTGVLHVASQSFSYHAWGKAFDIGNACDVDFVDALEYFGTDPETRVIVLHMEGFIRGREFLKTASRISFSKPIIVFKTGRTEAGAKAALSHTGSLVGEDEINDAAFSRAGIIRVKNASELKDAIRSLVQFENMEGFRLGVLTPTGAGGIMAADACEDFGLTIGELPEGLADKLKQGLPDWVHIGNPIDIWPVGMIGGDYSQVYKMALTELLNSPKIDGIMGMAVHLDSPLHANIDIVEAVASARQETGSRKPIAMWVYGWDATRTVELLESTTGVACFDSIERAVKGLSFCYRYQQIRKREISSQRRFSYEHERVESLLRKGRARRSLLGEDALALLSAFGIHVTRGRIARNWKEIEAAADTLSYPLVLKLSGEAFLHKSEWGGVVTGIRNKKELHQAFQDMKEKVRDRNPELKIGFHVQKQAKGKELLLGLKHAPQFGHILACGLGGIYTEVFKDISRELVPIGRQEAERMLSSLKVYPLLKGVRGEAGVDWEGLLDTLERVSFLAAEVPEIEELDINPLMADPAGCMAVDARILW